MVRVGHLMMVLVLGIGSAEAAPPALHRGVNVHDLLNWAPLAADGSYLMPPYRGQDEWRSAYRPLADWPSVSNEFTRIRDMGFDFVRLTLDPGPLLADGGVHRAEALAVIAERVEEALAADLSVVLNMHAITQIPAFSKDVINASADDPRLISYRETAADLAEMLVLLGSDRVAIEPFNEPAHYPCENGGDGQWQRIMTDHVTAIRAVAPDLTVVATGACGGDVTGLLGLDPSFDDENLLYSFHMYEPHVFTHQRLDDPGDFASGMPWPAKAGAPDEVVAKLRAHMARAGLGEAGQARNLALVGGEIDAYFARDWGAADVEARIGEAVDWAEAHGIPPDRLFMGEFGVIAISEDGRRGADEEDRLRYLTAVREAAEQHEIAWAVWEYTNPFGMSVIAPKGSAAPDAAMLGALGLAQ